MHSTPQESAAMLPPATGGTLYYPARHSGTFRNTRAALASLGVAGKLADMYLTNAKIEASDLVAVPVENDLSAGAEFLALICRKPSGRAELLIGIMSEARDDEQKALAFLAQMAAACPGRWQVIACDRQTRAVQ